LGARDADAGPMLVEERAALLTQLVVRRMRLADSGKECGGQLGLLLLSGMCTMCEHVSRVRSSTSSKVHGAELAVLNTNEGFRHVFERIMRV